MDINIPKESHDKLVELNDRLKVLREDLHELFKNEVNPIELEMDLIQEEMKTIINETFKIDEE